MHLNWKYVLQTFIEIATTQYKLSLGYVACFSRKTLPTLKMRFTKAKRANASFVERKKSSEKCVIRFYIINQTLKVSFTFHLLLLESYLARRRRSAPVNLLSHHNIYF
jgi:hypothetical protein